MLALNLFLKYGLAELLAMLNVLQLIIVLPLFESTMPANAGGFYNIITQLAVFDVLDISGFVKEWLELPGTDPVNEKYETVGLSDLYFTNNVGSFILILGYNILLVLIWLVLAPFVRCYGHRFAKFMNSLDAKLFWNGIAPLLFESFLNVILAGLITIRYNYSYKIYGDQVQTILTVGICSIYISVPFLLLLYLAYIFDSAGS